MDRTFRDRDDIGQLAELAVRAGAGVVCPLLLEDGPTRLIRFFCLTPTGGWAIDTNWN